MIARPGVLVDANVILDLLTRDREWGMRSARALAEEAGRAALIINPIIYAELSGSFGSAGELARYVDSADFQREDLPWEAAYLAGQAYIAYRRRGGERRSPMPDFYIGAHALVRGYTLLTRDAARYRTEFPELLLIAP